ncbi:MAG TPA: hypothetical protein VE591_02370 [Candidatus Acidoferrum sp.]|nr:hypothetical protein [Candidatus Acidoferrum sp.]
MRWWAFLLVALSLVVPRRAIGATATFADAGEQATRTLLTVLYASVGAWRECDLPACGSATSDWGVDSQTYALSLRWRTTGDRAIVPVLDALAAHAPRYGAPCAAAPGCQAWSDTPSWDAVALAREYEATGDQGALQAAAAAVQYVERSGAFVGGACPSILYQRPHKPARVVKSLETEANLIKAEILLYRLTRDPSYLSSAVAHYKAAREAYLDPAVPLYTVHVIDDGIHCVPVDHRFFASVNGDMIWNGLALSHETGVDAYAGEAVATAHAVDDLLGDGRGVFVDAAGENDVVEPLVEAMFVLADRPEGAFARAWIVRNAAAAISARAQDGTFARYFDGPAQVGTSAWQDNGGLALEIAAAALAPSMPIDNNDDWASARTLAPQLTTVPETIAFDGSGIALVGTLGRQCEHAHVRVFIDGTEIFDRTGLWTNSSMPGAGTPSVVFAWRWPTSGPHTLRLEPAVDDATDVHLQAYAIP